MKIVKINKSTFKQGLRAQARALAFMKKNGLLVWLLPASLLTILMSYGVYLLVDSLVTYIDSLYTSAFGELSFTGCEDQGNWWNCALDVIRSAGAYTVRFSIWLGMIWLKIKLMKYVVIAMLGPVMAVLSELTDQIITGNHRQMTFKKWFFEVVRGLRTTVLYFVLELSFTLLLLLISTVLGLVLPWLIPIIAPIEVILAFTVSVWFYGASVLDYAWEREGAGAIDSIRKAITNRRLALGLGLPFAILMNIPIIGWSIAPIIAPASSSVAAILALKD